MGFPLAFVHRGDGFPGYAVIIERVDIEPAVPVADPQQVPVLKSPKTRRHLVWSNKAVVFS